MKARALAGKTIRRVVQRRNFSASHGRVTVLDAIEFTDGSVLRFLVVEPDLVGEIDYGVAPVYPGRHLDAGRLLEEAR